MEKINRASTSSGDVDENRQVLELAALQHLDERHLLYFFQWLRWICVEDFEQRKRRPDMSLVWRAKNGEKYAIFIVFQLNFWKQFR